ncbi:MAG: PhnD/SsuA/transferrin family substrate-binding protein [Candidatus Latescibacterota bacterium]|nr:MAG: PhnD/SsuA/transferrin family substrate-binding protein [Candidatus Latescibacterota bacterium]
MKDKLRLIDVSLLSSYMGRALTVVVTVFVVSVAISAYLRGGRGSEHNVISVCVPSSATEGEALRVFDPLRALLSREARRPVVLSECGEHWPPGFDLYVMPIHQYLLHEETLDVVALHEVESSERRRDKAVIISRTRDHGIRLSDASPADVVFSHPHAVNGFWIQAAAMKKAGFEFPDDPRELCFEGSTATGDRAVFGVLFGAYRLGACKLSELTTLANEGIVRAEEFHVVHGEDVLPELVIAAGRDEAAYYGRRLEGVARLLDEDASTATADTTVRLLKSLGVCRLVPVTADRMKRTRELFEEFGSLFDTTQVVRP